MSKIPRYLNKGVELDASIQEKIDQLYASFVTDRSSALAALPTEFLDYFNNIRIISFRKVLPKSLNMKGDLAIKDPKVWVLWLFVLHLDQQKSAREIIQVLREGMMTVKAVDLLLEGFGELIERCTDLEIDEDDEHEIELIMGSKPDRQTYREVEALSTCGRFALYRLPPDQQKKLRSALAVIPVEKNPWVRDLPCAKTMNLPALLQRANYAYHPRP